MSKIHHVYKLESGEVVPGVTTVLGIIAKQALAPAANKLGLLGINSNILWRELADIGTIAHYLILCHLKKVKPDTSDYRKDLIDKAENSFLSYLEWARNHKIEPVLLETPLVSEVFGFGMTMDILCHLDEKSILTLIDVKTGNIYDEAYYQGCAYINGLYEHHYKPEELLILGIPRTVDENFTEKWFYDFAPGFKIFLDCLNLNRDIGEYKKGSTQNV